MIFSHMILGHCQWQWHDGEKFGYSNCAWFSPDEERPVLTKPLILNSDESSMDAGRSIDSTLPIDMMSVILKPSRLQGQGTNFPLGKIGMNLSKTCGSGLLIARDPTG